MIDISFDMIRLSVKNYLIIDDFFPKHICNQLYLDALNDPTIHAKFNRYNSREFDSGRRNYSLKSISDNYVAPKISFFNAESYIRSWSFIMDNIADGVGAHNDRIAEISSEYTCNVWVTPDQCVHDSYKNGLIIFDKNITPDSPIQDLINNGRSITEFLTGVEYDLISYKCNRAVIFKSSTIHKTNGVHMKPGHMNKRINYTFLYGK